MAKWIITTAEIVKRVYVIDAYTKMAALDTLIDTDAEAARETESLGEHTFGVEKINEYEYNREWKPQPDYNEGHDIIMAQKKDHEGYQYDAFKDQDLYRDD
jgi:hypothetical protein